MARHFQTRVSAVVAMAIMALTSGCSTDTALPRDVYHEVNPELATISQVVPPKAAESEGSAVVYVPPALADVIRVEIASLGADAARVKLCEFEPASLLPRDGNCSGVHYASPGLHHVRVDGLLRGEHTLEVSYFDSDGLVPSQTQTVEFEVPPLQR